MAEFNDDSTLANDPELKQIKRSTTTAGRVMAVLFVVGTGALGALYYAQYQKEEARWTVWTAAQEAGSREAFLTQLRSDFPNTDFEDVQIAYVRKFGQYKDAASVPMLAAQLDRVNNNVRGEIALAFASIGSPGADAGKQKLLDILPSIDVAHRAQVVWALAVLREARATNEIIEGFTSGLLQAQPGFEPRIIAEALGAQRLASAELTDSRTASLAVRTLVAQALSETTSPDAVEPLIRIMTTANADSEAELIRSAAAGLGRIGDPRAAEPLFRMLGNAQLRASIFDTLKRSVGASSIVRLLGMTQDAIVRKPLIEMLRATHDPTAADALAAELTNTDATVRFEAAMGLSELGDARAADALVDFAKGSDERNAQASIEALRQLHSPKAAGLVSVLEDHPARRAAVLKALGASGAPEAGATLMRELAGDDIEVALIALGELRYAPAFARIVELTKRPRDIDFTVMSAANEVVYRNRRKAIEALGLYGNPAAATALFTIAEDTQDEARLRAAAGESIGRIADATLLATVLEKVKNESLDPVARRALVQAFWHKPNREAASALMSVLTSSAPQELKRAVAIAIGYAADPANDARLVELLGNEATRRDAAFAVLLGGNEAAAAKLVEVLEGDRDLREAVAFTLQNDDEDAFQILTPAHFENGEVIRRIRVAQLLRDGHEDFHYGEPLTALTSRLKLGWPGSGGVSPAEVRARLYAALTGSEAADRVLAAEILGDMNERGLLIRARDAAGQGTAEAVEKLRVMNSATR